MNAKLLFLLSFVSCASQSTLRDWYYPTYKGCPGNEVFVAQKVIRSDSYVTNGSFEFVCEKNPCAVDELPYPSREKAEHPYQCMNRCDVDPYLKFCRDEWETYWNHYVQDVIDGKVSGW